jgi:AICAR transformylase/IMP cyclohydrolase PurH
MFAIGRLLFPGNNQRNFQANHHRAGIQPDARALLKENLRLIRLLTLGREKRPLDLRSARRLVRSRGHGGVKRAETKVVTRRPHEKNGGDAFRLACCKACETNAIVYASVDRTLESAWTDVSRGRIAHCRLESD